MQLVKYRTKQHPTINDNKNPFQLLNDFYESLPSQDLYQCADAAVLLVESTGACGVGATDVTMSCNTVSITQKSCATGYYRLDHTWTENRINYIVFPSFGHELGHNFGCMHNPEVERFKGDNHGHLIQVRIFFLPL